MLSNDEILGYREHGLIVIEPFEPRNLSLNSYDVTLGEWYYRERPACIDDKVYDIYSESEVKRVWGEPHRAIEVTEDMQRTYHWVTNKPVGTRIIYLEHGESILAHTNEFIGGRDFITTKMHARSSYGRNFIEVCRCAGLGDVGYVNRWTMEITNNSRFYDIPLVVGRRIAQITFFKTGAHEFRGFEGLFGPKRDYAESGKYQTTPDLDELKVSWKPEMMLPRLHLDYEIRK